MIILFSETAAFFCFLAYASFFEWTLHKYLMHTPLWRYPFRAHALVHHGLFRTGTQYFCPTRRSYARFASPGGTPLLSSFFTHPSSFGCKGRWEQIYSPGACRHSFSIIFFMNISITACTFPSDAGWKRQPGSVGWILIITCITNDTSIISMWCCHWPTSSSARLFRSRIIWLYRTVKTELRRSDCCYPSHRRGFYRERVSNAD